MRVSLAKHGKQVVTPMTHDADDAADDTNRTDEWEGGKAAAERADDGDADGEAETVAVRLYVPDAVDTAQHDAVRGTMTRWFGGVTETDGRGCWENGEGDMIRESVTDHGTAAGLIRDEARRLKAETDEDTVMAEVRPVNEVFMA